MQRTTKKGIGVMLRGLSLAVGIGCALSSSIVMGQDEPAHLSVAAIQPADKQLQKNPEGKLPSPLLEDQLLPPLRTSPLRDPNAPVRPPKVDPDDPPAPPAIGSGSRNYGYDPTVDAEPGAIPNCVAPSRSPSMNWFETDDPAPCGWFGSVSALTMTRSNLPSFWTTTPAGSPDLGLLNARQADVGWGVGADVRAGRIHNCQNAWEFGAWSIYGLDGTARLRDIADDLSAPLDFGGFDLGGTPVNNFFDNAREHRIARDNNLYSFEWNWLRGMVTANNATCGVDWLVGMRYFHFSENLLFGSVQGGNEFGDNGGINEAYLDARVRNHLLGVQFGARAVQCFGDRWQVFASPSVGVYGNRATARARIYRGDGLEAFNGGATENDFAMLAQLDAGVRYLISPRWSAAAGYRVLSAGGIALADQQILSANTMTGQFTNVDTSGNLFLHGAYLGVECRY